MFKTAFQKGLLTIFFGGGPTPLAIWESKTQNGYIKRLTDPEIMSLVMELSSVNVSTTYISCPPHGQTLGIHMPFLIMVVKNMNKFFTFEVTILDQSNFRRRFRVSNFESVTRIQPFCTTMPITLSSGWNKIQFNLAEFTAKAYKTQFVEVQRVRIHANIRLKRIYFAERIYEEEEMPPEYKLYFPVKSATKPRTVVKVNIGDENKENIGDENKEDIGDENKENITSNILSTNVLRGSSASKIEGSKVFGNRNSKSSINVASLSNAALVKASSSSMNLKSIKSKSETFINRIKSRQSASDLKTTSYDKGKSNEDLKRELSGTKVLSEIHLDTDAISNIEHVDKNTVENIQDEAVGESYVQEKLSEVGIKAIISKENEPKEYLEKDSDPSKSHSVSKDNENVLQELKTSTLTSYISVGNTLEGESLTKTESRIHPTISKNNNEGRNSSWQIMEEQIAQEANVKLPEDTDEQRDATVAQNIQVLRFSTDKANHFSQKYSLENKTSNESSSDESEKFSEENGAGFKLRESDFATDIFTQQKRVCKTMSHVINLVRCPSKLSVVYEEEDNGFTDIKEVAAGSGVLSDIRQHQVIFQDSLEMCFFSDNEYDGKAD